MRRYARGPDPASGHAPERMMRAALAKRLAAGIVAAALAALFLRQRLRPVPLPPSLSFLLENPVTGAAVGPARIADRLDLAPGMRVLDAGCGPGRVTVEAARRVEPGGEVVALDGQQAMLDRLGRRLEREGRVNVRPLRAELGTGELRGHGAFDRVALVMVLGEIRERREALRELYEATRPGGTMSVTEALGDPDYHGRTTIRREVEAAGFRFERLYGGRVSFTANFVKPERPG